MGIVTVPSGNFTPGAQATLDFAAAVINAAWDQANLKFDDFELKIAAIADETTGWLSTQSAPHVTAGSANTPTVAEPNVTIPQTQSAGDVMTLFDTKYGELVAELATRFTGFRTAYFPNDSATYAAAEAWLQNALTDGGLPASVAAQLLTDDKDRILFEASRASDAVLATFAARRFPLPPGASASAVLQIQQTAQDKIAESGRKLTALTVENMKFAVDKCINLRQIAMSSAIEYIKALVVGPDIASRLVGIGYDAQSKLISSAAQFYGVRAEVAKVIADVDKFNVTTGLEAATKNQAADLTLIDDRLKALLTEAQALAQMTTAMLNNLHASAGTSYSGSQASSV